MNVISKRKVQCCAFTKKKNRCNNLFKVSFDEYYNYNILYLCINHSNHYRLYIDRPYILQPMSSIIYNRFLKNIRKFAKNFLIVKTARVELYSKTSLNQNCIEHILSFIIIHL
jgi:hypothetical protein